MSEDNVSKQDTTPRYNINDTVTVSRGKHRGTSGTVIAVDTAGKTYAVQLGAGLGLKVLAFSAVKPKTERALTLAEYEEILAEADGSDLSPDELIRQHFAA